IFFVPPSQVPTTLPSSAWYLSTMVSVKSFTPLFLILASISDLSSSHGFTCAKAGKAISMDATTAKRLFISYPLSWLSSLKSLPKHSSPYATRKSRSVEIHEKTRQRRVFFGSPFRGAENSHPHPRSPGEDFAGRGMTPASARWQPRDNQH